MTEPVRVNVVVEGQTEETFVRDVLAEPMGTRGVYLVARCVETGRRHGTVARGGLVSYAKAKGDVLRWLAQDRNAFVTTMFDFFRLPNDFPGWRQTCDSSGIRGRVTAIEDAMSQDIGDRRLVPYVQVHEFEALLFSDVQQIDKVMQPFSRSSKLRELQSIRDEFQTPEEIDEGDETAPSKRLLRLYPQYDKVGLGPRIAARIGVERMRKECPHFSDWISKLESLR